MLEDDKADSISKAMDVLGRALECNAQLKVLSLGTFYYNLFIEHNGISGKHMKKLEKALSMHKTLAELNLGISIKKY